MLLHLAFLVKKEKRRLQATELTESCRGRLGVLYWACQAGLLKAALVVPSGDRGSVIGLEEEWDMSATTGEREHWRRLRETHIEVLRVLELQAVGYGELAVPPHIVTEIEDRKEKIAELGAKLATAPPPPVPEAHPAELGEEQVASGRLPFEPEMILIPAGEFLMGSDPQKDKDAQSNEQPQHTLYLPDYTMAKTPVTNAQYAEFVRDAIVAPPKHWQDDEPPPDKLEHPVVNVNWHDAVAYCDWLGDITSKPYRLPSEAEWEKAARGTDGRIYPWSNRWYPRWCNTSERGPGDTTPVGAYPRGAGPYGLLDMAGNVWEWTRSRYKKYPYAAGDAAGDGREHLEASGSRVVRGGSWIFHRDFARCASRVGYYPDARRYDFGFRVVVSPISPSSAL